MTRPLAERAGSALLWQASQHATVKGLFMLRLFVLARLLDPQAFGLVAMATVATSLLLRLSDFGMVPALIQRPRPDDRHFDAAWTWGVLRASIVLVAAVLAAPLAARVFDEPAILPLVQVIAVRPLLEALASIRVAELNRDLRFRALAAIRIPDALVNTVVSIALAPALGVWALVLGALAGTFGYLVASYLVAPRRPRLVLARRASRELLRFGRWIFLSGLIVVAGSFVLRAAISRQLGAAELGLYFLAARLAFLPSTLVSEVVGAVAFPVFGRLQSDTEAAARAFRALLKGLAAALLPVSAILFAAAPELVELLLGPRWQGSAPLIRVLAIAGAVGLLGEIMVPVFKAVGQPYRVALLEGVQSASLVAGVLLLVPGLGALGAALAWLPAIALSQVVGATMLRGILPRPFAGLSVPSGLIVVVALAGAGVAAGVLGLLPNLGGLALAVGAAASLVVLLLWQADRRLSLGLAGGLERAFPQVKSLLGWQRGGLPQGDIP